MRRRIASLIFIILSARLSAFAEGSILYKDTATQVQILASSIATGLAITSSGVDPTFSISLIKHADSGAPTVTTWTPTNSGGGTHDCFANNYEWTCELTATDTNTLGRTDICWHYPGAFELCDRYTVIPVADTNWYPKVTVKDGTGVGEIDTNAGLVDLSSVTSKLPAALTADGNMKADTLRLGGTLQTGRDIGTSVLLSNGTGTGQVKLSGGYVGPNLSDVNGTLDAAEIGADAITAAKLATDVTTELQTNLITIKKNTAYPNFPVWMLDANNAGVTGLTDVVCRVQLDGGAWATIADTTETEPGGSGQGRGLYKLDLAQGETNGNDFSLECTGTGAVIYRYSVTTQH